MTATTVHTFETADDAIEAIVATVLDSSDVSALALTGGRAGAAITSEVIARWPADSPLRIWFSDERFLPIGDDDRNDSVAIIAVDERTDADITIEAALGPESGVDADGAATDMWQRLTDAGIPELAVVSIGPDGHVASVFPGHALLEVGIATVCSICDSPKPPATRITWTLPLILKCSRILLVAIGADKMDAVTRLLAGDDSLPATRLFGEGVELFVCTK
jgi:6-phosphogluconolactonase